MIEDWLGIDDKPVMPVGNNHKSMRFLHDELIEKLTYEFHKRQEPLGSALTSRKLEGNFPVRVAAQKTLVYSRSSTCGPQTRWSPRLAGEIAPFQEACS